MLKKICSKQKKEESNISVLQNIDVIDGINNQIKHDMVIIVKNGIITDIGKKNDLAIPQNANVLDFSKKTAIPGLIDSHLHLLQSGVDDFMKPYAESITTKLTRNSYITVKSGVTTVRNMPGGSGYKIFAFRKKVNQGTILGPRIITSGPALAPSYGYFSVKRFFPDNRLLIALLSRIFGAHGLSIDVDSEEEAIEAVEKLKKKNVDFIKTVTPGAHMSFAAKDKNLKEELLQKGIKSDTIEASMKPEVLKTIVNEAHNFNLKVSAHTICFTDGFKKAVQAGVDSIEHTPLGIIDDETFEMMKRNKTCWVPTGYCFYNWTNFIDNPEQYNTDEIKELIPEPFHSLGKKSLEMVKEEIKSGENLMWNKFYSEMPLFKENYFPQNFKRALEKGIQIVAAVDGGASGAGYVPHGQLYKELELFVEHGMSEFEAIQTATINAAELLGVEKKLGSIEVGKIADFVILDNNPLKDISHLKNINSVIKDGVLVYNEN
ncbi:MAG: amidohydrolase family protein [Bacteroidales bacterium]